MSLDSTPSPAASARLAYHQQRIARLIARVQTAPSAPDVEGIIDPKDGTLDKDVIGTELQITLQKWENLPEAGFDEFDVVQLEIARVDGGGAVGDFNPVGDRHDCDSTQVFPMVIPLGKDDYPENGQRQLRYRIEKYNGNPDEVSATRALIFDKTPPWGTDYPPEALVADNVLTDAFFSSNPQGLKVTLPPYTDQAATDSYALFYSNVPPVEGEIPTAVATGPVPANRELLIPKSAIETQGDGRFFIVYALSDKATNVSKISRLVPVDVNLGTLPADLQPPVVPLAADGLLDLEDAQTGITVEIPAFSNHRPSDVVEITWGTSEPFTEVIGSRTLPLLISVPRERLLGAYGKADDKVDTSVSYRILRGQVPYGPKDVDVVVDFSIAGPGRPDPDDDWPDPVNSQLAAPVVTGAASAKPNELDRTDTNQPATLTFALYDNAKDGELVDFYWDGVPVTEATHTVDTAGPGTIAVQIPWSYILAAGNDPALPVHYTVRKPSGAGNRQRSLSAAVNVNAIVIEPVAAEFLRLAKNGWLNCNSLWEDPLNPAGDPAFKVAIKPLDQYLPNGGEVTLVWTALGGRRGDDEITAAKKTETLSVTKAQAENGFEWEVKPYAVHILPIYDPTGFGQDGRGRVHYTFDLKGELITSKTVEAVVSLGTGSGTCALP